MALYLLYESASGYALFEAGSADELGAQFDAVQASIADFERFGKTVKLVAFRPFTSAADALEQVNAVSESQITPALKDFLEQNLPKVGKKGKGKLKLGVAEAKLGSAIQVVGGGGRFIVNSMCDNDNEQGFSAQQHTDTHHIHSTNYTHPK